MPPIKKSIKVRMARCESKNRW